MLRSLLALSLAFLGCSFPLPAQVTAAHAELWNDGRLLGVNVLSDSDKPIDAFHVKTTCPADRGGAGASTTYDALNKNGDSTVRPGPGGTNYHETLGPLTPHGVKHSVLPLGPPPSGCIWVATVDGVIYTDGSDEGDPDILRRIQMGREGFVAQVRYWRAILPQAPGIGPAPDAFVILADKLATDDLSRLRATHGGPDNIAYQYWSSAKGVDMYLQHAKGKSPVEVQSAYDRFVHDLARWQHNIDTSASFKKLQADFPLPDDVKTVDRSSYVQTIYQTTKP